MPVEIVTSQVRAKTWSTRLRAQARDLLKLCRLEEYELSLLLTDDGTMRELNRRFRGRDYPTDVLSFPQIDWPSGGRSASRKRPKRVKPADSMPLPLGDVVISLDTARRQARELGVTLAARLRALLIHGLLHLLGYDHEASQLEARRMFRRASQLEYRLRRLAAESRREATA
jgi:rRNA maturation RNase YbeY